MYYAAILFVKEYCWAFGYYPDLITENTTMTTRLRVTYVSIKGCTITYKHPTMSNKTPALVLRYTFHSTSYESIGGGSSPPRTLTGVFQRS